MGPASDEMAVVDQQGKIHGLENIRKRGPGRRGDCRCNRRLLI